MTKFPEGNAIVYCEGAFGTTNGKTAHGLVRRTARYKVVSVIDSRCVGKDAGAILDGRPAGIPIYGNLRSAVAAAKEAGSPATHLVVGLAPDGGRLRPEAKLDLERAIKLGLNVDCGLHDFLNEDPTLVAAAREAGVTLRDVRMPPSVKQLHGFTGKIEQVTSLKVAVLGTDSAVGKRTTAWLLVEALQAAGHAALMVGTGQTAWMQGAPYGIVLDSIINDFVAGELEHAVWSAWQGSHPEVIVVEGQGSLMNPAYPGGHEILAATRPDVVVLQHAPARKVYDGFPDFPMHPLEKQIQAIELISGKPVVAITVNHEDLADSRIPAICAEIQQQTGRPTADVLRDGAGALVDVLMASRAATA